MEPKLYPCCNAAIEMHFSLFVFIVYITCFIQVQTFFLPFVPHSIFINIVHFHVSYFNQISVPLFSTQCYQLTDVLHFKK
jgi:hypothetical protein